jgi:hypothetical protein
MGHMQTLHDIDTCEITNDGKDVRHHTPLPLSEFDEAPSLITTIEVNHQGRQQDGKQIDHDKNLQFICPWENTHITESK